MIQRDCAAFDCCCEKAWRLRTKGAWVVAVPQPSSLQLQLYCTLFFSLQFLNNNTFFIPLHFLFSLLFLACSSSSSLHSPSFTIMRNSGVARFLLAGVFGAGADAIVRGVNLGYRTAFYEQFLDSNIY